MALKGNTDEARIWNFCIAQGLTEAGAAGLMGNLYAESALDPKNLQNSYDVWGETDGSNNNWEAYNSAKKHWGGHCLHSTAALPCRRSC